MLKSRAPEAAHAILSEGDAMLVWSKRKKASDCKWTGLFQVLKIEGKVVTIADDNGAPR